jgi:hypothetical protein
MSWLTNLFFKSSETISGKDIKEIEKETQAELKALCMKMKIFYLVSDLRRYEELLAKLYKMGVEPQVTLK